MNPDDQKTHFGYDQVPLTQKTQLVEEVFSRVANNYDLMNDLMSLGIHRLWKKLAIDMTALRQGQTVLDLAGGTGDLTVGLAQQVGTTGKVILADINSAMLQRGRERLTDRGLVANIHYVQANAECLPFADNYFDRIMMAFGLRNVTDKDAALRSMYRVLKPGGRCIILEFSTPPNTTFKKIYDAYSFSFLPWLGKIISNDQKSYRYLAESIRMHPNQQMLKSMMEDAGFEKCEFSNLTGGIVAIHKGFKFGC